MFQECNIDYFFSEFKGQHVDFIPNKGNIGDVLIHASTLQLFKTYSITFNIIEGKPDDQGETLVIAGGGNLIDDYNWLLPKIENVHNNYNKIIILPSSISGVRIREVFRKLGKNVKICCREKESYKFLLTFYKHPENLFLCPDLAFSFDFSPYLKEGHGILNAFRKDSEKTSIEYPSNNIDLSDEIHLEKPFSYEYWNIDYWVDYLDQFLNIISSHKIVNTNRLHVAIAATLMNKEVYFFSNKYYKNQAVYYYSLWTFPNISFIDTELYSHQERDQVKSLLSFNYLPIYKADIQSCITIVVSCSNEGAFILEAIDSICRTGANIIVVNKGADDPTSINVLKYLKGKGYNVLELAELASNRMFELMKFIKTKYVMFFDGYDRINPAGLSDAISVLKQGDYDLLVSKYVEIGNKLIFSKLEEGRVVRILLSSSFSFYVFNTQKLNNSKLDENSFDNFDLGLSFLLLSFITSSQNYVSLEKNLTIRRTALPLDAKTNHFSLIKENYKLLQRFSHFFQPYLPEIFDAVYRSYDDLLTQNVTLQEEINKVSQELLDIKIKSNDLHLQLENCKINYMNCQKDLLFLTGRKLWKVVSIIDKVKNKVKNFI